MDGIRWIKVENQDQNCISEIYKIYIYSNIQSKLKDFNNEKLRVSHKLKSHELKNIDEYTLNFVYPFQV